MYLLVSINLCMSQTSVSRLCCDLGSMVNNPQLSDVQLQVDSGDVYFAHSFMLYTRCPLLANMVTTLLSSVCAFCVYIWQIIKAFSAKHIIRCEIFKGF